MGMPLSPADPAWVVVQNRPGSLDAVDSALIRGVEPAYVHEKLGVPLVWVFRFEDVQALRRSPNDRSMMLQDPAL
jgi:hypothetical protein